MSRACSEVRATRPGTVRRVAALAVVAVGLCAACSTSVPAGPTTSSSGPGGLTAPSASASVCVAITSTATPHPDAATLARVRTVVDSVAAHAWNGSAPPSRGTGPGGVYINWRPSWDGHGAAAAATNIQTSGGSDADAGAPTRHDPLADLLILHGVTAYLAVGGPDPAAERLRCLLSPVVASELRSYGVDRGWVYGQLIALAQLDSAGPWLASAQHFAELLARSYLDPATGAERNPRSGTYRSDYAAEVAAALVDAGQRFHRADWVTQGGRAATWLLTHAADPSTGLFPGVLRLSAADAHDGVVDPMVKIGAQAQLLDALLSVSDVTHDPRLLAAVQRAVATLDNPAVGVTDPRHGGYYYAVDAGGTNARTDYKETRQAWVLPLLQHLQRITGSGAARTAKAENLVRDSLYRPNGQGYVYRVAPDLGEYVSSLDGVRLGEEWISSEATGIALVALTGPLS
jgi:hypothetical protein